MSAASASLKIGYTSLKSINLSYVRVALKTRTLQRLQTECFFTHPSADFSQVGSANSAFLRLFLLHIRTFRRFWFSFGILTIVSRSQCPHCFLFPHANLLETNFKTTRNQFTEPTLRSPAKALHLLRQVRPSAKTNQDSKYPFQQKSHITFSCTKIELFHEG